MNRLLRNRNNIEYFPPSADGKFPQHRCSAHQYNIMFIPLDETWKYCVANTIQRSLYPVRQQHNAVRIFYNPMYYLKYVCCNKEERFEISPFSKISCHASLIELNCQCVENRRVQVVLFNRHPDSYPIDFRAHLLEKPPRLLPQPFYYGQTVYKLPTSIIHNKNEEPSRGFTTVNIPDQRRFRYILCTVKCLRSQLQESFRRPHLFSKNFRIWNKKVQLYSRLLYSLRLSVPDYATQDPLLPLRINHFNHSLNGMRQMDIDKVCKYTPLDYLITKELYETIDHDNAMPFTKGRRTAFNDRCTGDVFTSYTFLCSTCPISLKDLCFAAVYKQLDKLKFLCTDKPEMSSVEMASKEYIEDALDIIRRIKGHDIICKHGISNCILQMNSRKTIKPPATSSAMDNNQQ